MVENNTTARRYETPKNVRTETPVSAGPVHVGERDLIEVRVGAHSRHHLTQAEAARLHDALTAALQSSEVTE